MRLGKGNKPLEVGLGDGSDGVEVCTGAVVLGQVPSQTFVYIRAAQNQKTADLASNPRQKLSKKVR